MDNQCSNTLLMTAVLGASAQVLFQMAPMKYAPGLRDRQQLVSVHECQIERTPCIPQ